MSDQDTPDVPDTDDFSAEALKMGWSPKEKFRGDPSHWVDAKTYVERGRQFLPLVQANNRRLQEQLSASQQENKRLASLVESTQASVEELRRFHQEDTRAKLEDQKKQLMAQLKQAKKDDDVDAEVEIGDQIQRVNAALLQDASHKEKSGEKKPQGDTPAKSSAGDDATQDPAFLDWLSRNAWFGKDRRKTLIAQAVATDLAAQPNRKYGAEFWQALDEELGDPGDKPASKVDAGSRGAGGGGGGRSYKDLPAEARAVCDRQANTFVGEGKAFKDKAAWQAHYAKTYFDEE